MTYNVFGGTLNPTLLYYHYHYYHYHYYHYHYPRQVDMHLPLSTIVHILLNYDRHTHSGSVKTYT